MSCEITEAIVRRVLVCFAECRVVKDLLDEFVDGLVVIQSHEPDVDEFGGALADEAHSKKLAVSAREDKLQHSGGVTNDVAARVVYVEGAPYAIVDLLFLAGFFGFTGSGNFRNGVNPHREH